MIVTPNKTRQTDAALLWLQTLLHERFGHTFSLHPQSEKTLQITLGADSACIELLHDTLTFTRADSDLPCTQWNATAEGVQTALHSILPAPGASVLPSPLIEPTESGYRIHYDILGLTYWMLSRHEEVGRTDLDNHGRFPATSSHASKHGYLERPIVDEWLHVLGQFIQRTWPRIRLKQNNFTMKVSHDVDRPSRYGFSQWSTLVRTMGADIIKRGELKNAVRAPWIRLNSSERLNPRDPDNTFDWIMDVSERYGLVSAFYFICGRTAPRYDAHYDPEHPAIRELMRRISARGHEIGLHPSYNTHTKPNLLLEEFSRLRKICAEENIQQEAWGGRMHYLRWEHPTTMHALAGAGLTYDSTLGYADQAGFRCGTCFDYPAFDPINQRAVPLRIQPLIAMECSVMLPAYMGLGTGEAALAKFIQLRSACSAVRGCFTLLWHNSQLQTEEELALYLQVCK